MPKAKVYSRRHADLRLTISRGRKTYGDCAARNIKYNLFVGMFERPNPHAETVAHYQKLSREEKTAIKERPGYIIGAKTSTGRRTKASFQKSQVIALDADRMPTATAMDILSGLSDVDFAYIATTTCSHVADAPESRLRIFIPAAEPFDVEKYAPVARVLAEQFEATMLPFDEASFLYSQLMYKPGVLADGEYLWWYQDGPLIEPDAVLEEWTQRTGHDWNDYQKLPQNPDRAKPRKTSDKKMEDPLEKTGIVGAVCRVYFPIQEGIDTLLTEEYGERIEDPSGYTRYTYLPGQGHNGAVVYDDKFLHSHHGTDPCGGMSCNFFDLYRIHKYGEEDDGKRADAKPTELKSFKLAKADFLQDPLVKRELASEQVDADAMDEDLAEGIAAEEAEGYDPTEMFEDLTGTDPGTKGKTPEDWRTKLELDKWGNIKNTLPNIIYIMRNDERIAPALQWNEHRGQVVSRRPVRSKIPIVPRVQIRDRVNGDLFEDQHGTSVRTILESERGRGAKGWGLTVTMMNLHSAVDAVAILQKFHPVQEYLDKSSWDGTPRAESLFIDYLGAEDNAYHRETARLFLIAAVARAYEPGHKFDFVPVLEGAQGIRKSTFVAILAKNWFRELTANFDDTKAMIEQMQGAWIAEVAELSSMRRATAEAAKAFLSGQETAIRMAYGRRATSFLRQCVFMGTTNKAAYLIDSTGNRRFWPIRCTVRSIDTEKLASEIDQIWAEAAVMFRDLRKQQPEGDLNLSLAGEPERLLAEQYQDARRQETPADLLAGKIEAWLDERVPASAARGMPDPDFKDESGAADPMVPRNAVCVLQIKDAVAPDRRDDDRFSYIVGDAMALLDKDWRKSNVLHFAAPYNRQRAWVRIGSPDDNAASPEDRERYARWAASEDDPVG